jgi:hypothetical protein
MNPFAAALEATMLIGQIPEESQKMLEGRYHVEDSILIVECATPTECLTMNYDLMRDLLHSAWSFECGLKKVRFQCSNHFVQSTLRNMTEEIRRLNGGR